MATTIQVWSDFVCPYCLLAEEPLHRGVEGLDVDIEWMPFELRAHPTPTLRPEDDYLQTVWASSVYPMARRMGVDITLPDVSPQPYTRLAFEGYQYARAHQAGEAYTPRVLRAFFQESRDIGRIDVLSDIASELGLDAADFRTALEQGTHTRDHQDALRLAAEHRVNSVPTFLVAGIHRIEGVPDPVRIRKAVEAAQAGARDAGEQGAACGVDGC